MRLVLFFILFAFSAGAFQNEAKLKNPDDEARARELFQNIRCQVCQGESLNESNADLAIDMRKLVRDKIAGGESDEEIKNFLVSRYGDQILQEPPFENKTYLLWFGPLMIFIFGSVFILKFTRLDPRVKPEDDGRGRHA